jgi:beta-glucosidase
VSQTLGPNFYSAQSGGRWEGERCVGQTGSVPRLGIRSLCLQDSPLGVRDSTYTTVRCRSDLTFLVADYASAFPAGMNIAATWSRDLAYARGQAMGEEHRGKGVDVQLGPVCGPLGRAPEGGRNWVGRSHPSKLHASADFCNRKVSHRIHTLPAL